MLSRLFFADDEILIHSGGLTFVVAKYVIFMSSMTEVGKKQISRKLPNIG